MWLNISTSGLKILHFDNYSIQDSYALSQIAYTTILPANRRVFAFISANTSVQPPIFKCHVFKSNTKVRNSSHPLPVGLLLSHPLVSRSSLSFTDTVDTGLFDYADLGSLLQYRAGRRTVGLLRTGLPVAT